jgi:hypothetical protein
VQGERHGDIGLWRWRSWLTTASSGRSCRSRIGGWWG